MSQLHSIPADFRGRLWLFTIASGVLFAVFATTLVDWFHFSLREDLFSYILIVPLVTAVLTAHRLRHLELRFVPAYHIATGLAIGAALFLTVSFQQGGPPGIADAGSLCWRMLSFVSGWIAVAVWSLGGRFMSGLVFPAAFLVCMTPLPPATVDILEMGLQHASAEVTSWLFPLVKVPFFRTDLCFQLPNVTLEVAPQCSGIRSTLVLFITSLIAGHLYLERPWQRAVLSALVIPLGILRNAVRIVTIGWLCTRYGPQMIHSPIHHRGGPVFFAIALLPLFAMLWLFRKFSQAPKRSGGPLPGQLTDQAPD